MALYLKGIQIALKGVPMTIVVSIFALMVGILFGMLLALIRTSNNKFLKTLVSIYIEVVRGTPMIVQALVAAYGLPMLLQKLGVPFKWPSLILPALLVCGLNSAAYMAEVIRGGLQAVDIGQREAALSLGMTRGQINKLIVIPQAIRIAIPAFGNEFVTMIKETAVLAYVGVIELLRSSQLWIAATYNTFEGYIGAAIVYLMLTFPLSKLVGLIEKKLSKAYNQ
ncbi:MAG: amino acid ABC transporter permease [Firmicutes bacterium]|nr:amino acid ABC transporter permease [Bacillota bacterium]